MPLRALIPLLLSLHLVIASHAEAPTFRLAGSTTVARALMPYKPGVEAAHNVLLMLIPVGSGRGLSELTNGRVDAAMVSGPVQRMLENVHRSGAPLMTLAQLELLKLPSKSASDAVALLHPSNPLRGLDLEQIAAILCGEITNWKQCGGDDRPITVILPAELDGVRCALDESILLSRAPVNGTRIVPNVSDLPAAIALEPGAIGIATRAMPPGETVQAEITPTLNIPLYIVARRAVLEANPKLETVLNALHSRAR